MSESYISKTKVTSFTPPLPTIVSWANGTDAEVLAMVEADRQGLLNLKDYWNLGDIRTVTLSAMSATGVGESHAEQSVELVLMDNTCTGFTWAEAPESGVTVPRFIVGMKDCLNETGYINSTNTNQGGWKDCARRSWCNNVFSQAVPSTLRSIFKQFSWKQGVGGGASSGLNTTTDTFGLTPEKCIFGSKTYSFEDEASQYSQWVWYQTSSNRVKTVNGSASFWWECSPLSGYSSLFCRVFSDGSASSYDAFSARGLSVFGCI